MDKKYLVLIIIVIIIAVVLLFNQGIIKKPSQETSKTTPETTSEITPETTTTPTEEESTKEINNNGIDENIYIEMMTKYNCSIAKGDYRYAGDNFKKLLNEYGISDEEWIDFSNSVTKDPTRLAEINTKITEQVMKECDLSK